MQKTVLVTGASSGIGYELCKLFAQDNNNIVLVARDEKKLNTIANELKNIYGIQTYVFTHDLTDDDAPQKLYTKLQEKNINIDILVNNAGFGVYGHFKETNLTKELDMMKVNMSSLVELTKLFLPRMTDRKNGKIMNVASTASFQPGPGMAIYYASKAFVLSFSEAISEELQDTGVTVTTLCPGPTKTGFENVADMKFSKHLQLMTAKDVADIGYRAFMKGKRIIIPGLKNKFEVFILRFTPRKIVTKIVWMMQKD
ncbi:SDR family oxidoreductase [Candidatus Parcubacteria bacterium]|jgi:uncharacterized protein|nr:SDR family oxidoreductase [Candidatus Parcubacteria bacterium]MBT3949080.1 SDR family oxidoreductase [Candidatus Parcubacteria bacterium]